MAETRGYREGVRAVVPLAIAVGAFGDLVRGARPRRGDGQRRPHRDVGHDVRRVGAVRGGVGARCRRLRRDGGDRGGAAERPVPAAGGHRGAVAGRRRVVAAPPRAPDGRRIVGGRRRGRGPVEPTSPSGRRRGDLGRLGARHHDRRALRRPGGRPITVRAGRRLPRAVPGAARAPAAGGRESARVRWPSSGRQPAGPGRAPGRQHRARPHPVHRRGRPDRGGEPGAPLGLLPNGRREATA